MTWTFWIALSAFAFSALATVFILLVIKGGSEQYDCDIDERQLEGDLRNELSDISFGGRK